MNGSPLPGREFHPDDGPIDVTATFSNKLTSADLTSALPKVRQRADLGAASRPTRKTTIAFLCRSCVRCKVHRILHSNASMPTARLLLVVLILLVPAVLLWDTLVVQGVLAGLVAVTLAVTGRGLRSGESAFLISIIRPLALFAAVPAVWIVFQILPLRLFANPIWKSAETAIGSPLWGSISIDPGASVIALGKYLLLAAIVFLSAAVAVERQRAGSILSAMTFAVTVIALIALANFFFPVSWIAASTQMQAIDLSALGVVVTGAACMRAIEHYESSQSEPQASFRAILALLGFSGAALIICSATLVLTAARQTLFAAGYGFLTLVSLMIIRRYNMGLLGILGITIPALGAAILFVTAYPASRDTSFPLAFAGSTSPARTALNQRILDDAPNLGTGAGTFAALAPVYRGMTDPASGSTAITTAAAVAIDLGRPMLWLAIATAAGAALALSRGSLRRGRDSFYPAMGASCLVTLVILAFVDPSLLGTATGLITANALGLSFAQSRSRTTGQQTRTNQ